MGISPKTNHDLGVRGVLVGEIKVAFYEAAERSGGAYFPLFLLDQHVALAGEPLRPRKHATPLLPTWRFTGGSEKDFSLAIEVPFANT